jgi:Cu(I)/Ag(I) efflux system membrane protein CusA/SilA
MIPKLIEWSLRNRFLVACGTLLIIALGIFEVRRAPVDAIPDLSENQVIVFADWEGRAAREVEDQVTYPLSTQLQGLAGVKAVRAQSMFGFSLLTVIFRDDVDNYFARSRVLERLNSIGDSLPAGVSPKLGPDASGLGWVYQYYLDVDPDKSPKGGYDLGRLRAEQDFFIRYALQSVPGVAEVAGIGGFVRQWQVEVSSFKMKAAGVSLDEVMTAVGQSSLNVGGRVIEENGMEFIVRGLGLVNNAADLEHVVLREREGTPIYLRDVARIEVGGDFRRGALDVNGHEVVGGVVVMRTGENAHAVIKAVKEEIGRIAPSLPAGVTIKPFYDRSELIDRTIGTLKHALIEEVILVTLAHVIFLFHFRSILIVTFPLPVSILMAFILMRQFGITSNVMSLAGIAIAIGVLVDAAIVITENVIRHCERAELDRGHHLSAGETWEVTLKAAQQVGRPIFFAMAIIILAFVPVFALTGQEGKLFHPLAFTKTFAMVGSTLLAVTIVPVLCTLLVRGPFHREEDNWVMRALLRIYDPVLDWALRCRKTVLALAAMLLVTALTLAIGLPRAALAKLDAWPRVQHAFAGIGGEFMPPLNEGSLLFMPVFIPTTSLTEVKRVLAWQDRVIAETPEVLSVGGKLGRAETATDPAPVEMIETTIMLKPQEQWREGMTLQKLQNELTAKLAQVPGYVPGAFLQPIENRRLMLATGIRAQLGVKILGDDLDTLQRLTFEVERVIREVHGAAGVSPLRVQGKPYLEIEIDREAAGRYGLRAEQLFAVVEAGLGGRKVATTIEGRVRIPIQVRLAREERDDIERIGSLLVGMPNGKHIPLAQVATIRRTSGPNEIQSENGRLKSYVQANVQDRDLAGFVKEVKARVEAIPRPPGVKFEFAGEYENQIRLIETMWLVVPCVLVVIFLLLYIVYGSAKEAAHVILAVPFALTGGVFLQYALGYNFSAAVAVGYIALFGTAIQTGVVMVVYLEESLQQKRKALGNAFTHSDLIAAIKEGARLRLRPKVMTVATIVASLLPIMWSTRTGAEVMKPLAAPVIGGMLSSLLHILVVTPVIFAWLRERECRGEPSVSRN